MKQSVSISLLLAAGAFLVTRAPAVWAQSTSPFTLTVNVTSKTQREVVKGDGTRAGTSADKTTDYEMEVTVLNRMPKEFADLTLKYYWFASEADSKVISILRTDEKSIKLAASASTKVPVKPVSYAFKAKQTKYDKGKNISVPPSGYKYAGYGIRIIDKEGKILAKKFDPIDLEKQADATAVVPEKK